MKIYKMFIDGEWTLGEEQKTAETLNPATGKPLAEAAVGSIADVDKAVAAARRSFYEDRTWRDMDSQSRSDLLYKISYLMEENMDELARLDTMDMGKPLREAECDVDDAIHTFRYYAGLIKAPYGGVYDVNEGFGKMHSYTVHEPVGVCALITPWNYPLLMGAWKIAPALAAGNSIIYKPSSNCMLSSVKLFEILEEAGLPKGVANLVLGSGGVVGNALAEHEGVEMVTFTGSTSVGQSIMRAAAGNVKKIGLELGGKSPNVIFADTDIDAAVEWAMIAVFLNQGEICSAGSRIIIEESIKEEFLEKLVKRANAITIGDPLGNPDMGPLVSKDQMERVLSYIDKGKAEGAKLLCGGERYTENGCGDGYFVRPTVFSDCTSEMTVVREEIFGPVVTVQTFKTEQEAIDLANDTEYGLAGAVFTADITRAIRVIKEIRAGITWINCYNPTFNEAPWGGYKRSGIGRELGIHGLEEYQEIKQININLTPGGPGWYRN